jgi:hypothetical protein
MVLRVFVLRIWFSSIFTAMRNKKLKRVAAIPAITPPGEMANMNKINWFVKETFDVAELKSPQPCEHGAGCDYRRKDPKTGAMLKACCRFVHPGEEGNGRRLFPARTVCYEVEVEEEECPPEMRGDRVVRREKKKPVVVEKVQPACVRLTGRAGYYERCRLRLSWADWCSRNDIPYTANKAGSEPPPLMIVRIGGPQKGIGGPQKRHEKVAPGAPKKAVKPLFRDEDEAPQASKGPQRPPPLNLFATHSAFQEQGLPLDEQSPALYMPPTPDVAGHHVNTVSDMDAVD